MKITTFTYLLLCLGLVLNLNIYAQIEQDVEEQDSILNQSSQNEFQPLFFKALSERGIENYEKSAETLEKLIENFQDKPELYFQLGLNYFDLEQYSIALEQLERANSLKPNNFDIQEAIFKVYEQQKRYDEAIEIAQILANQNPEYYDILSNIYLITKQHQKALEALDKADIKQGFDAQKDALREVIFKDYDNPKVAIKYYKERIKLEPYNPMNAYRLVSFLITDRQYDEALESSKTALDKHARFTRFYVLQIKIYLKLEEVQNAFKALETVVKDRFLEEKYKVQAIELMKNYIQTYPEFQDEFVQILNVASQTAEDTSSYLDLGLYYFESDKPKALDNFKKALEQNPQDFQVWKNIAVLQWQLQQYTEALKTTNKALEIYPSQAVFMVIKGKSLLKLTQYNQAKKVLLEALSYTFEENEMMLDIYNGLALTYQNLNDIENAKIYQNKAKGLRQKLN